MKTHSNRIFFFILFHIFFSHIQVATGLLIHEANNCGGTERGPKRGITGRHAATHTCARKHLLLPLQSPRMLLTLGPRRTQTRSHSGAPPTCIRHLAFPRLRCLWGKVSYKEGCRVWGGGGQCLCMHYDYKCWRGRERDRERQ